MPNNSIDQNMGVWKSMELEDEPIEDTLDIVRVKNLSKQEEHK